MDKGKKFDHPSPREGANVFSIIFFLWTFEIFSNGCKKDLESEDLYNSLKQHESGFLGDKLSKNWEKVLKKNTNRKRPSFFHALFMTFGWQYIIYGVIFALIDISVSSTMPIFLGNLIKHFTPGSDISKTSAYLFAGGIIMCTGITVVALHPYIMAVLHIGMKVRVSCCSLMYRKVLRLSKFALGSTTVGQMVNLMSNDVNRFDMSLVFAHYIWVAPLHSLIIIAILWFKLGMSSLAGVVVMLLMIPLQSWMGRKTSRLRAKIAARTDERVKLMNEIITGIQVIKMYTWEIPFAKLVSAARKAEIKQVRYSSYIRGIYLSFVMFTTRIAVYSTILAYILFGNEITADKVFMLASYYSTLCYTLTLDFPQAIARLAETWVSIKRIEKFLLYEEMTAISNYAENKQSKEIALVNATAKWSSNLTENTLDKINLSVKPGMLVAVIGPVGAGKTSLLQAILGELPLTSGSIKVNGKISYSCQEPFTFAGTIRQNILFGQPYERKRYNRVVEVCALTQDFKQFPYGDSTVVGERGVSLSGGQRARITLARAVYNDADFYFLDDPLSAVDSHVGRHLFDECIADYLSNKTRILVTHQLQYLKKVDEIIILNNGVVEGKGKYEELQKTGLDFALLLKHDEEDAKNQGTKEGKCNAPSRQTSRMSGRTDSESMDPDEMEEKQKVEESRSHGSVSGSVYGRYFAAGGHFCVIIILFLMFFVAQILASSCDFWVTFWTNVEELRQKDTLLKKSLGVMTKGSMVTFANESSTPDFNATFVENTPAMGGDQLYLTFTTENCIYIYTALIFLTIVFSLGRSFLFFTVCMRASVNLHNAMFQSIVHAAMRFFNTNPSGRILNRFSRDMGLIDEMLPQTMIDTLQIGLALMSITIMVSAMNFWLILPTLIIGLIFYLLRTIYLSTSRSVKRLEGLARSPVFSHLNASLQGLTTIRAFGAQNILIKEFDNFQDLHSSAWFMFIATSRAFGLWLDLFCFVYISLVTISFLFLDGEIFGGNVGLAITQSIALTGMFQWGMRQSAEMENQMTSVERVVEYTNIEKEPPLASPPDSKPPKPWPQGGKIVFDKLYLHYNPDDPPVLRDLNFVVNPHEKVGIVGRTGAGKSSLIAALFRLTDLRGSIIIDGLETTKAMGLHDLRSKISIIPQEPFIFSGTLRKNLDPFDEFPDYVLKKAIEEVELKDAVEDLAGGIDAVMSEGGSNLSVGQRQLVCLARAIIRNNKILVLDEATANVDPKMDAVIQKTIRDKFSDCTVLTIAHRLHTVMDADRILVMDDGQVAEFDKPFTLLQNTNGVLFGMVQKTGKAMADTLHKLAKEAYNQEKKCS